MFNAGRFSLRLSLAQTHNISFYRAQFARYTYSLYMHRLITDLNYSGRVRERDAVYMKVIYRRGLCSLSISSVSKISRNIDTRNYYRRERFSFCESEVRTRTYTSYPKVSSLIGAYTLTGITLADLFTWLAMVSLNRSFFFNF